MERVSGVSTWLKLAVIPLAGFMVACSTSDNAPVDDENTALSSSYKVEYVEPGMGEKVGKNTFFLRISKRSDGSAASGEAIALMPVMNMVGGMKHATPVGDCSEMATAGDYRCSIYYVMASEMNGVTMGDWALTILIGGNQGESVTFHPSVMMAMGDTAMVKLKGVSDQIPGMPGLPAEQRTYYLFNDGIPASDSFSLFIAARESMMSFPALQVLQTLNAATAYELTVDTVMVELSTDGGTSWDALSDNGSGHWSITGLSLTAGQPNDLRVRLTVNGETKTTDGSVMGATYQTFTVTP